MVIVRVQSKAEDEGNDQNILQAYLEFLNMEMHLLPDLIMVMQSETMTSSD